MKGEQRWRGRRRRTGIGEKEGTEVGIGERISRDSRGR